MISLFGCGSQGAGEGADVGVGLSVIEHTAQYDTHSWKYHAPTAVCFLCFGYFFRFLRPFDSFLKRFSLRCSLNGRISEHADRVLSMLGRGREGCCCRREGGGDLTFSRSSRVVSTSATRLTRSANRRLAEAAAHIRLNDL